MATSKLIKAILLPKPATPLMVLTATEVSNYSYTSARVAKPVYNKYKQQPLSRRYLAIIPTGLSMMVACKGDSKDNRGRGYDLTNISPTAYDKIIFGFVGVTGFHKNDGQYRDVVAEGAEQCGKLVQPTFLDPWVISSLTSTLDIALAAGMLIRRP